MRPPTALSVSCSDPSGATGIQADLRTFSALGVYGTTAITALGAGTLAGIRRVRHVSGELLTAQLEGICEDMELDAVKIGAVGGAASAVAIAELLENRVEDLGPVILDPVMVSRTGDALITAEGLEVLIERILPLADVITPSPTEAAQLLGEGLAEGLDATAEQAQRLAELAEAVVVLTGGHLSGDEVVDIVVHPGGTELLRSDRILTTSTHGTGDTFSAAITAQYARLAGYERDGELEEIGEEGDEDDDLTVIASAREFLASAIENARDWELSTSGGPGPLNHLITLAED